MNDSAASSPFDLMNASPRKQDAVSGSAERSLKLLSLLAEEGRAMSFMEITSQLALAKGTVHRLCSNLAAAGYLVRDVDERLFLLGPAMRRVAFNALNHATLRGMRHAVLKDLVSKIEETCNFTTLDGHEVLYLDRVEARWPLRLTIDVGSHVPLHCTSSGKLLLAHLPKRQRDTMIKRLSLTAMTATTITTIDGLRSECDAIVERGYARDEEEFVEGLISIAVPVRDPQGDVRATVSVHAPKVRLTLDRAESRIPLLKTAAESLGRLI
ncbi:IclR family transcriptional regulator [Pseudorhodoferax soli]|uniref:IclR family transcriptional regulator n=1 Tax=Pseudorhodoferax soli TaxID=545864 RepID=A0A368X5A8_9BURK|nr:IclR family transcriptional regulator [Pseudorhodoferax soli]RCW63202.1 IclR family transcriptional regulator [Pseudorhodoferax soli]